MRQINRLDAFIGRFMPFFVLYVVFLGILFPDFFGPINRINVPLFFCTTFANSLGGGFRDLFRVFRHPLPVILVLAIIHVAMPLCALGLGSLLFPEAPLFTIGLVLEYCVPVGVATLMWTGMASGNVPLCLSLVLLDTICTPFILPATLQLLVGSQVEMDPFGMMGDLLIMVAIPAILAMICYDLTKGRVAATLKPTLAPFSKMGVLAIICANATGCSAFLRNMTPTLAKVMIVVFTLCLLGFFLGYWAGRLFRRDYPTVQTMSITSGMRNISAGAVLAEAYFPPDVLFPVAFSPIFLQATTAIIVKVMQHTKPGKAYFASLKTDRHA